MPWIEGSAGLTCPGPASLTVPIFSGITETWNDRWAWLDTGWQDSGDKTDQPTGPVVFKWVKDRNCQTQ